MKPQLRKTYKYPVVFSFYSGLSKHKRERERERRDETGKYLKTNKIIKTDYQLRLNG